MTGRVEFSHRFERSSGWATRTVYAENGRVMVQFEGEAPYVQSYPSDAEREVTRIKQWFVDDDHAWALRYNRQGAES